MGKPSINTQDFPGAIIHFESLSAILMITTDEQIALRNHDVPALRARGIDEPTPRSFAMLESNGRPCHTVGIRVQEDRTSKRDPVL